MIDSFIQNDLKIMILHVSSQSKPVCVLTSGGLSNSVGWCKNNLLSSDLLQTINDIMFDNHYHFVNQHRFDYSVPIYNENDVDNC
jgi:hypothetical protein